MAPSLPPRFQNSGVPVAMFRSAPDSKVGLCQRLPTRVAAYSEADAKQRARTMWNRAGIIANRGSTLEWNWSLIAEPRGEVVAIQVSFVGPAKSPDAETDPSAVVVS